MTQVPYIELHYIYTITTCSNNGDTIMSGTVVIYEGSCSIISSIVVRNLYNKYYITYINSWLLRIVLSTKLCEFN